MSQFRRQDDRRRRVLMTTASATSTSPAYGSRMQIESMRDARRPTLVYGTRVRQGLRGRWFSLVPVDRAALMKVTGILATITLFIVLMNDATVRFSYIESRPAFVNVFQINRLGSLGRYVIGMMYLATAGAAWMVYQLRRFRNDDFRGNYRLWQWVVGVCLVASVATLVPLLEMLGAAVEALMGQRIALSGHDWIGLFLVVGGAVLALRTIAEMSRYRISLTLLISGWFCAAIPVAAQWNILAISTNLRWSIVTSTPLLAVMLWMIASITYLRSLYCEVRGIAPSTGFLQRLRESIPRPFSQRGTERENDLQSTNDQAPERRAVRKPAAAKISTEPAASVKTGPVKVAPVKAASGDATATTDNANTGEASRGKRRWFGLRGPAKSVEGDAFVKQGLAKLTKSKNERAAVAPDDDDDYDDSNDYDERDTGDDVKGRTKDEANTDQAPKERRRWWPILRGRSTPAADAETSKPKSEQTPSTKSADSSETPPKKPRFGLGSIMKRKTVAEAAENGEDRDGAKPSTQRGAANVPTKVSAKSAANGEADDDEDDENDEEGFDDDGVDWSSMNKAERRRMRKQLKRGGKAA